MNGSIWTLLVVVLAMSAGLQMPAEADERSGGLRERPAVGEPLRFRDASGGSFRPHELVIQMPGNTFRARLPEAALEARNEDRIDLSSTPILGGLFQSTLAPSDASAGERLGPVLRRGDQLVVVADQPAPGVTSLPVVLTSNLPRLGAVSYETGSLSFSPVGPTETYGLARLGEAFLLDGRLVLAADGGGAAWPSVEALFEDIFR